MSIEKAARHIREQTHTFDNDERRGAAIDAAQRIVQCLQSAGGREIDRGGTVRRIEASVHVLRRGMPLVGLSCKPFPQTYLPTYVIRSYLLYIPFDEPYPLPLPRARH